MDATPESPETLLRPRSFSHSPPQKGTRAPLAPMLRRDTRIASPVTCMTPGTVSVQVGRSPQQASTYSSDHVAACACHLDLGRVGLIFLYRIHRADVIRCRSVALTGRAPGFLHAVVMKRLSGTE